MLEKKQAEKEALARQQPEEASEQEQDPEPESNSDPDADIPEPKPEAKPKRVYKRRKPVAKPSADMPPSPIATPAPRPYFVV